MSVDLLSSDCSSRSLCAWLAHNSAKICVRRTARTVSVCRCRTALLPALATSASICGWASALAAMAAAARASLRGRQVGDQIGYRLAEFNVLHPCDRGGGNQAGTGDVMSQLEMAVTVVL